MEAAIGEIKVLTVSKKMKLSDESGNLLVLLEAPSTRDNLKLLEALDFSPRPNSVSLFVGYGPQSRLLQEGTEEQNDSGADRSNVKINATATGALLISLTMGLIAAFGLIMMGRIQTPQAFAKRDLIKGSINK
eukprot:TRINITY_DN633_c0_g5_i4.p3 TRINITY_DN633_c0_g5~~TRINITY_DN633_c0_g5_i4.p3  ORF type:complete len:133 (-),score=28.64 TRINITY_DN633_c0_g5_i4:153-551(-)